MSVHGRDALKGYFKVGKLPSEDHFHELIDSMLHMDDEGFHKTPDRGLEITSEVDRTALVSLGRHEDAREPSWTLEHGDEGRRLKLQASARKRQALPVGEDSAADTGSGALLTLDARQRVGIRTETPAHALEVEGVVAACGRAGTYYVPDRAAPLRADGNWQVLAKDLSGCVAFEVVASVSAPGRAHAILHANALNAHNPPLGWFLKWFDTAFDGWFDRRFNARKRIRYQTAWWGERCDRLELRWSAEPGSYRLEIRTQCQYPEGVEIQAHVTKLWPADGRPTAGPAGGSPAAGDAASFGATP